MSAVVARSYLARGWTPVPIPPREKAPAINGWPKLDVNTRNVDSLFKDGCNVGVILGERSGGLVDVDLDSPEAVRLAPQFLPPTGAVFGRAGKPRSHWLYVSPWAKTLKINDGRASLVELRSDGGQTVFPGSVHPSGEPVEWAESGEPATVAVDKLTDAVVMLGRAAKLVRQGTDPELACWLAREGPLEEPKPQPRKGKTISPDFAEAVLAYNRANSGGWPKSGGTCPACGHNGCFATIPGSDPPRWYCFSAGHGGPGVRGKHGYHGDALELAAWSAAIGRGELLRRDGYLTAPEAPKPLQKESRKVKQVVLRAPSELVPPDGWEATLKRAVVAGIAESLKREGLRQPLVILTSGRIVHGVHRWAAAKEAGLAEVECVVVEQSASVNENRAAIIAENLFRGHLDGPARDALLAEIVAVRAGEFLASPEEKNSAKNQPSKRGRREGRPKGSKSAHTRAVEVVAAETGTTPKAVRLAEGRVARREREEPPKSHKKKPEPPPQAFFTYPPGLPEARRADFDLLTKMADECSALLIQVRRKIKQVMTAGPDGTPLAAWRGNTQCWYERAHQLAYDIRIEKPVSACPWCRGKATGCKQCGGLGLVSEKRYNSAPDELRGEAPSAKSILRMVPEPIEEEVAF